LHGFHRNFTKPERTSCTKSCSNARSHRRKQHFCSQPFFFFFCLFYFWNHPFLEREIACFQFGFTWIHNFFTNVYSIQVICIIMSLALYIFLDIYFYFKHCDSPQQHMHNWQKTTVHNLFHPASNSVKCITSEFSPQRITAM